MKRLKVENLNLNRKFRTFFGKNLIIAKILRKSISSNYLTGRIWR